ncbi:hypothetical protein LCGC14_1777760 [marine sediment metagenome]|uniref:Uncharacterized protein n=1 Tax=marine sediment metagenome TaxID=412755 RepID=A0A0F9GW85_9ZZZZ
MADKTDDRIDEHFVTQPGDFGAYATVEEARAAQEEAEQQVQQVLEELHDAEGERVEPPDLSAPYFAPTDYTPEARRARANKSATKRRQSWLRQRGRK